LKIFKQYGKFPLKAVVFMAAVAFICIANYFFDLTSRNFSFISEKIVLIMGEREVAARAEFTYRNRTALKKILVLFYPFYLKEGHATPEHIQVFRLSGRNTIPVPFDLSSEGMTLNLDFAPGEEATVVIIFVQKYDGKLYKFILGYNRPWGQKIQEGEILLETGTRKPSKISLPMTSISEGKTNIYTLRRHKFTDEGINIFY